MIKKTAIVILVLAFIFSLLLLSSTFAEESEGIQVQKGKNHIEINQTLYAKELVSLNPEIESISYFDEFLNKNIGYVDFLDGIGSNFLIEPGQIYEISVSEDTTIIIYQSP